MSITPTKAAWPPPPDLASIKELVRDADTEGFIALGSPADEYDHEAELLFAAIGRLPTEKLTAANIKPHIEIIWTRSFEYDTVVLEQARPALLSLAQQIARFFGPEAQPQTRNSQSS
jgi:hypothetical protein